MLCLVQGETDASSLAVNHNSEAEAEDTENFITCHVNGTCNDNQYQ